MSRTDAVYSYFHRHFILPSALAASYCLTLSTSQSLSNVLSSAATTWVAEVLFLPFDEAVLPMCVSFFEVSRDKNWKFSDQFPLDLKLESRYSFQYIQYH